jgi:DNA-binding helix-hairpin-helix protein with protein kinase domain
MSLYLPDGREIRLGQRVLGRGAEGLVHDLAETPDLCAKIYLEPAVNLHQRLVALMRTEPASWAGDHEEHKHVAWPRQPLLDETGRTIGFLMPTVEGHSLTRLFDPYGRVEAIEEPTWRVVIGVAARAARLLSRLHSAGIVVGDVSPANILVSPSGHVTLIDCDTVQFTDPATNILYPCAKLTPEYAPPILNGSGPPVLTPGDDAFSAAVLICQLLMEGDHPFEGVPSQPLDFDAAASDNIKLQNNRIVFPERLHPIPGAIASAVLPPQVRQLAHECFGEGHRNPGKRPLPQAWETALEHAGFELMGCRANDRHLYHSSLPSCVWCDRIAEGFDDRYPPAQITARIVIPVPIPTAPPQPTFLPTPAPTKTPLSTTKKVLMLVAILMVVWFVVILIIAEAR